MADPLTLVTVVSFPYTIPHLLVYCFIDVDNNFHERSA
jgi:hypothetical protein